MKDELKKPCKNCPFSKGSMKGYLGAYKDPKEFLDVHYRTDQQNPCHMTVDYERDDWQDQLPDATACVGQQIMYRNSYKEPRVWSIPADIGESDDVFKYPNDFMEHHTVTRPDPGFAFGGGGTQSECFHCTEDVDDDTFCHGCGVHICEDCENNHTLMGQHDPMDHLDEPEEDEWG
jgi:hypothetical protein